MISLLVLSNASGRFNTSRGGLTLAYWHLDTDGPNISGELVDPHIAEGVAQNFLFTNKWLEPCSDRFGSVLFNLPMDAGTSLSGLLGSSGGKSDDFWPDDRLAS